MYFVTHWLIAFLPCVATRVTMLSPQPKSIWSHWLILFALADQAPRLRPAAWKKSLPCMAAWFESHWDDEVICQLEIPRSSMPRAWLHTEDFKNSSLKYTPSYLNAPKYLYRIMISVEDFCKERTSLNLVIFCVVNNKPATKISLVGLVLNWKRALHLFPWRLNSIIPWKLA